jgi:hypothetical protein
MSYASTTSEPCCAARVEALMRDNRARILDDVVTSLNNISTPNGYTKPNPVQTTRIAAAAALSLLYRQSILFHAARTVGRKKNGTNGDIMVFQHVNARELGR